MRHPITGPVVRGEQTRTSAKIGERMFSGLPCSDCATRYIACTTRVLAYGRACCVGCANRGTHDEREMSPFPSPLADASPAADGEHVHVCVTCGQVHNGERWVQA